MKERPILFSGPMVRAILAGQKTQTRRLVRLPRGVDPDHWMPQQASGRPDEFDALHWPGDDAVTTPLRSPYGAPGDLLWVRETWAERQYRTDVDSPDESAKSERTPAYAADWSGEPAYRWRPSIHMPRWASRLSLEVVSIRVERLQEINEEDAKAEGVALPPNDASAKFRSSFQLLWDSINGKRATWASNPWVWVIEFRRLP